jgi:lysophospholipase L1-like esterase
MRDNVRSALCAALITSISTLCFGQDAVEYPDPGRFEEAIQTFEAEDERQPPPEGAIVGIGSSSMRGWHETIGNDLAPLTVIPRGFGGSNMNDALHFMDRILIPYRPRAVLVYEGDNDIAQSIAPEKVAETFQAFAAKVHRELPGCRIYFLSIKPSIARWRLWPEMKKANSLIRDICVKDDRLTYVDVASPMLDEDGQPRKELFKEDGLHLERSGYELWRDVLKPILLEKELEWELHGEQSTHQP